MNVWKKLSCCEIDHKFNYYFMIMHQFIINFDILFRINIWSSLFAYYNAGRLYPGCLGRVHLLHPLAVYSSTTPEEWIDFSNRNIIEAEKQRQNSTSLRSILDGILQSVSNDMTAQKNAVDLAMTKRIAETRDSKAKLEDHLLKVCDNVLSKNPVVSAQSGCILYDPVTSCTTRLYSLYPVQSGHIDLNNPVISILSSDIRYNPIALPRAMRSIWLDRIL